MIQVATFIFNAFGENMYLLYDDTKACVIIDPGCYDQGERYELDEFISSKGLKVERLINTHCHIDHVLGVAHIQRAYGVTLEAHELELPILKEVEVKADIYGFPMYEPVKIDKFIREGVDITFGQSRLKVLFTPGHAPGHVVFYAPEEGIVIGGDVLFRQSVGRTDLLGGDFDTLIESIHKELFSLPDETVIYPGHGPETTVGFEKVNNPFCSIK